jgi:hypothetical protein
MGDDPDDIIPDDIILIEDPKINAAEIVRRVEANLRLHRFDQDFQFPQFDVAPPRYSDSARLPPALYYDLERAALALSETWIDPDSVESRIPLLGPLKRQLHRLAVYYVNRYAERQMSVNASLLRVANQLAIALDDAEVEAAGLRQEVDELKARVKELEVVIGGRSDGDVKE